MLFVCCQLLKYSRELSWNWRCAFDQSIGSHRVTWECNNPLRRFCCVSQATIPGTSWSMEPVCPWSHIWTLVRKNKWILSKRGHKSKHWCCVDAQQTRTENSLENQGITCADVQRAGCAWDCPELLQESVSRGFHWLRMDRTRVLSPAVSEFQWRCRQWASPSSTRNLFLEVKVILV